VAQFHREARIQIGDDGGRTHCLTFGLCLAWLTVGVRNFATDFFFEISFFQTFFSEMEISANPIGDHTG